MKNFKIDPLAFLVLLVILITGWLIYYYARRKHSTLFQRPSVYHSNISIFKNIPLSWKERLDKAPKILLSIGLFLLSLAFIDPHIILMDSSSKDKFKKTNNESQNIEASTEGLAIYLTLDRSGSMREKIYYTSENGSKQPIEKMEALKQTAYQFIKSRNSDLIGLIAFARKAEVISPLTFDHEALIEKLEKLESVKNVKDDGTAIGYAIFKTAHLIVATKQFAENKLLPEERASYDIKNNIIILVTDGLQNPHPEDSGHTLRAIELEKAAEYAAENNIKLYIINIEPAIRHPRYINQRQELEKVSRVTGGKLYIANDPNNLQDIYLEIDKLEKNKLSLSLDIISKDSDKTSDYYPRKSLYPILLLSALVVWITAELFEKLYLRRTL